MTKVLSNVIQVVMGIVLGIVSFLFFVQVLFKVLYDVFSGGIGGLITYFVVNIAICLLVFLKTQYKTFSIIYIIVTSGLYIVVEWAFRSGNINIY